jgi:hypothetical protein
LNELTAQEASMLLRKAKSEAQEFEPAFSFPSILTALAMLGAADVAIAVSMILSLG